MVGRKGIHVFFVLTVFCAFPVIAQQDPLYSMYMFDKVLINPAYAGSSNWAVGTLKYREQARSYQQHPVTQTFNFHTPIQKKHLGIGLKVVNDQIGIQNTLNASAFLSYQLTFARGKLSAGIEAGVLRRTINYSELVVTRPGDVAIPATDISGTLPDLAAGLYYQKKQFYMGASAAHLLPDNDLQDNVIAPARHFYLLIGNVFVFKKDWTFDPSLLVKYSENVTTQVDVNMMVYYDDRFGIGVQYRTNQAVMPVARIEIFRGLRIAYSFDYGLASTQSFAHGAHEIVLSYGVKLPPPPHKKEIHPRYYF